VIFGVDDGEERRASSVKSLKGKYLEEYIGPKYENGEWRTRTNRELEEMSKEENIVKWIK
jgi:hypothetical protein